MTSREENQMPCKTSISIFITLAISQHYFHCMTTHEPTTITTDRKDSGSLVQRGLSYPSRHAIFSVTQLELPCPIKYDHKSVVDYQEDSNPVQLYMLSCPGEIANREVKMCVKDTYSNCMTSAICVRIENK